MSLREGPENKNSLTTPEAIEYLKIILDTQEETYFRIGKITVNGQSIFETDEFKESAMITPEREDPDTREVPDTTKPQAEIYPFPDQSDSVDQSATG